MFTDMEKWAEIRRRVLGGEISKRAACAEYDIHWDTLQKILTHSEPPGYRRTKRRPSKLDPFLPIIHEILEHDRTVHRKQRHTAKRIFERLRDEHGYTGGMTLVKDAVAAWKQRSREVFLPLSHRLGEAQVDFGFADVLLGGELTQVALFVMTLPYSDAVYIQAFSRECTESFLEGHTRPFYLYGGLPTPNSNHKYKNALAKKLPGREPNVTREIIPMQIQYLIEQQLFLLQRAHENGQV